MKNKHSSRREHDGKRRTVSPWLPLVVAVALGTAGCSHSGDADLREPGFVRIFAPQFPDFLRAPMGLLLTNGPGYSAQVEAQSTSLPMSERTTSGQLLSRGGKLLFAPQQLEVDQKSERAGGFMFIWDINASSGLVVSEALQGYAPVSTEMRVTNVIEQARLGAAQKVAGHSCSPADVVMQLTDGTTANFEACRAADLNGLAVQFRTVTNSNPRVVTLSKIRPQVPAPELFAPPEGFTRYGSPEAMADEIAARQRNLRRGNRGALEPIMTPPPDHH
jgi:hypothetical protein